MSHYIMVSVPSAEHEKVLWIEKNLSVQREGKNTVSIRPNKSAGDILVEHSKCLPSITENLKHARSLSDDGNLSKIVGTPEMKERSQSTNSTSKDNRIPMEKRLETCLKELKIPNAVWVLGRAGKYYQVSFCTTGEHCERIVQLLNEHEIGVELNSTVSILPCSLYYEGKEHTLTPNRASPSRQRVPQTYLEGVREMTAWEQFLNSVSARLMVAQVVAGVKNNAVFTFDFLILLIIASVTAAVGLVENSVVVLVASMLISPLMGPVMASTFGFVTRDWKLQKIGMLNELLGLMLCVLIGFLYGFCIGYLSWESPDFNWPTPEMLTRGDLRSLWVGALIALLSGAAVSIAVLGNYSGSLTGVAISASLMPPAVNAGLVWSVAVVILVFGDTNTHKLTALNSGDPVNELIVLGALSLALTFINILCIFLMGILVLKVKEVTPRGSKDYSRLLWKETIQIARDYKYNLPQSAERVEQGATVNQLSEILSQPPCRMGLNQYTWSAYGALQDLNRPTVHDLASAWHQLTLNPSNITDNRFRSQYGRGRGRGSPSTHVNLARLWSVMSSPSSTFECLDEQVNSPGPPQASVNSESKRFTVIPTDVNKIIL